MPRTRFLRTIAYASLLAAAPTALATRVAGGAPSASSSPTAAGGLPAVGTVTARYAREGAARPNVLAGVLSAPRAGAPVDVARAYLATQPEPTRGVDPSLLRVAHVQEPPGDGAAVRFQQTVNGVEVYGSHVSVRMDAEGRVRWVSANVVDVPAGFSTTPRLSAADAIDALITTGPLGRYKGQDLVVANQSKLVVYAVGAPAATPRLAYEIVLPRQVVFLETMRAFVDAQTGETIKTENLVQFDRQANVYHFNPVSTPTVEQTQLETLPSGATQLDSPDVLGRNCVDNGECISAMGFHLHFCGHKDATFDATAKADGSGDFLSIQRPASDLDPTDSFAEVEMFFHTSKQYEHFRTFGFTNLKQRPITALANVETPDFSNLAGALCTADTAPAGSKLVPFDNAAFMPAGNLGGAFPPSDMMVFGQGTMADFAYDGDVVYHEFTHAVVDTVSMLGFQVQDASGIDPTPGGMQEGFADYFSSSETNDPEVGEYAGKGLVPNNPLPSGAIRSLENTLHCPESLWGESHQDSNVFSGGLWDVRKTLSAADQAKMDKAVYTVVTMIGPNDGFDTVQTMIAAEIDTALGATTGTLARAKFHARGLDGCNQRVVDLTGSGATKDVLFLNGGTPAVPGPVQFHIKLDADATEIKVSILGTQAQGGIGGIGGGTAAAIKLLVKPGTAPITWTWPAGTSDAAQTGDVTITTGGNNPAAGKITGAFPKGDYVVMLANAGGTTVAQQIGFSSTPGSIVPDAGPNTTPDASGNPANPGGSSGGCGCHVAAQSGPLGGAGAGVLAAGLAGFLLVFTRRRR